MESRLKFLDEASEILRSGEEVLKIGSHLRYLRDSFVQQGEWKIHKKKDPIPLACPHCLMEFGGTLFTITVKPRPKPNYKLVRIMLKAKSQELTEAEKATLAHYEDTRGKKLVLKCGVCQKETQVTLRKQKVDFKIKPAYTTPCSVSNTKKGLTRKLGSIVPPSKPISKSTPHIRKKKKKDQFAGLKKTAVMSVKLKKKM